MNGKVHYWIVCDAVRFIKDRGSAYAKKALEALQAAYGEPMPVEEIRYYEGAVQNICGYVSSQTDHFRDLAFIRGNTSPTNGSSADAGDLPKWGFCGHNFSTFHHFINAFVPSPTLWDGDNGYYYGWGSHCPEETFPMGFISEGLDLRLDQTHSPALDRLSPYYRGHKHWDWEHNVGIEVWSVVFAPVSVLARYYYTQFVQRATHTQGVVTNPEEDTKIAGLHLLGPVLHAVADAVVPQHIRPALGFCHQAWENTVETLVCKERIALDRDEVEGFLKGGEPFNPWCTWTNGPTAHRFAEEFFISRIAGMTRDRLCTTMGVTPKELWDAKEDDWKFYMKNQGLFLPDAQYFYNLAVAGTVHAIVRAYHDLLDEGILSPQFQDHARVKLAALELDQFDAGTCPRKMLRCERDTPGFLASVIGCLEFHARHAETESEKASLATLGTQDAFARVDAPHRERLLADLDRVLARAFPDGSDRTGLPASMGLEDTSAFGGSREFGVGSYRLPSVDECTGEKNMACYLEMLDHHHQQILSIMKAAGSAARKAGRSGDPSEHPSVYELNGVQYLRSFFCRREGPPLEPVIVPDPFPDGPTHPDVAFRQSAAHLTGQT